MGASCVGSSSIYGLPVTVSVCLQIRYKCFYQDSIPIRSSLRACDTQLCRHFLTAAGTLCQGPLKVHSRATLTEDPASAGASDEAEGLPHEGVEVVNF